jgi:ATP-dependent DNA helicase RecQ
MAWGLSDVAAQRRFIEESEAGEDHKRISHAKLDALLGLVEAASCRRVALLHYFGEASGPCGNCDNCLTPPTLWDGTEAARKALSAVFRTGQRFGAGHVIDVLLGKPTDKVVQWGHDQLAVFGIGQELDGRPGDDKRWRSVIRQMAVRGWLKVDHEAYGALQLTEAARPVLRGEVQVMLREELARTRREKTERGIKRGVEGLAEGDVGLFERLRDWRRTTALAHNVPAYVILHDATLRTIAALRPASLGELAGIAGIGASKLERYGADIVALVNA